MQGQLGIVFASEGMPGTKCGAASLFYHDREDEEKRQAGQEQTILLEMACRVGHLEVVKYLLGEGARCGPPSEGVVQELLPRSKPEIATWLRSIIGWQPLHFACEADDEPMIMRLLLAGAWSMRLWFGSQVRTCCSLVGEGNKREVASPPRMSSPPPPLPHPPPFKVTTPPPHKGCIASCAHAVHKVCIGPCTWVGWPPSCFPKSHAGAAFCGAFHELNLISIFVCVYTLGSFLSLCLCDHHGRSTTTSYPTTDSTLRTARRGFP